MSKGINIVNDYNRALISYDTTKLYQLIDSAISKAYKLGFMARHEQEDSLINPEDEDNNLANKYVYKTA